MFCKWCGLESETSDVCSWCHEPFSTAVTAPPAPPQAAELDTSPPQADSTFTADDQADFGEESLPAPFVPLAPTAPPPRSTATPPGSTPVQPAVPPLAPPGGLPPGYRPSTAQPIVDRPDLQAIPIKRAGDSPPVIPIAKPQSGPPSVVTPAPSGASTPPPPVVQPRPPITTSPTPANLTSTDAPRSQPPAIETRTPQPLGDLEEDEPQIGAAPSVTPVRDDPGARPAGRTGASPQPLVGATATAVRTGTRVYCRHCGMESDTPDICSWCHKDLRNLPPARPKEAFRQGHPIKKGPHRHEVKPSAPQTVEGNGNGAGVPALGTFTAQKSRYYPDKVYDPVSGAHYDADTGQAEAPAVADELEEELEPVYPLNQLAVNVAILIGLAVVAALMGQRRPDLYLTLLGVTNFFAGMAMPLLRTVPFGEDDSSDIGIVIGLILILGPFVGAMLYFFYCFVKQDFSPAMVGVFVSYLVLRFTLDAVVGIPISRVMPWSEFTPETVGAQIMPFITIAGWYAAGIFHKPDE